MKSPYSHALELRHPAAALAQPDAGGALHRQPFRASARLRHPAQRHSAPVPEHARRARPERRAISLPYRGQPVLGPADQPEHRHHHHRPASGALPGIPRRRQRHRLERQRRRPRTEPQRRQLLLPQPQCAPAKARLPRPEPHRQLHPLAADRIRFLAERSDDPRPEKRVSPTDRPNRFVAGDHLRTALRQGKSCTSSRAWPTR